MTNSSLNKQDSEPRNEAEVKWMRVDDIVRYYGIGRSKVYQLCKDSKIQWVHLQEPGMSRGTRLISKPSLDAYIESFIPRQKGEQ